MYLKRIFEREQCKCVPPDGTQEHHADPECKECRGKGFIPKAVKGVKVLRILKRENQSPNWVDGGLAEGWLSVGKGKMTLTDIDGKDYVFQIARTPGIYCCHDDARLGDCGEGGTPDGAARMRKYVSDHFPNTPSPDPNNPAGYRQDNFYALIADNAVENMTAEEAQKMDRQVREALVKKIGEKHLAKMKAPEVLSCVAVALLCLLSQFIWSWLIPHDPQGFVLCGNFVFNIALGRVAELYNRVDSNDPANSALIIILLASSGVESDATLKDKDDVSALVSGATNEATNTGYARKVLTDSDIAAFAPDDTNDRVDLDIPDQTWTGVANDGTGAISDLVVAYDNDTTGGTDSNIVPLTQHDFSVTPDGSDITAQIASAGFFRAS